MVGGFSLYGLKLEHCKGRRLLSVYPYALGGGFNPSGRWACDIVEVRAVCGLGAGLTVIHCRGVFLLHGAGGLDGHKNRAGGRFNPQPLGGSPCYGKIIGIVTNDFIAVAVLLGHLSPTKVVRAGLVGAGCLVGLEKGFTIGAGVHV